MKTLKEQKIESKKAWEKTFKKSINDSLTKEDLKKFWDEETSLDEALDMLTCAAINDIIGDALEKAINDISNNKVCVLVIGLGDDDDKDEDEKCETAESEKEYEEGSMPKKFAVLEKEDGRVYPDRFETDDEAYDFIKVICMNTAHTFDDFKVVEEK